MHACLRAGVLSSECLFVLASAQRECLHARTPVACAGGIDALLPSATDDNWVLTWGGCYLLVGVRVCC